jgi:hypothetical protein
MGTRRPLLIHGQRSSSSVDRRTFRPGVSRDGNAAWAQWTKGGREIVYVTASNEAYAAPVLPGPEFRTGAPELLSRGTRLLTTVGEMDPAGERWLLLDKQVAAHNPPLRVVTNWAPAKQR